jgi:hypothetical protein
VWRGVILSLLGQHMRQPHTAMPQAAKAVPIYRRVLQPRYGIKALQGSMKGKHKDFPMFPLNAHEGDIKVN